MGERWRKVVVAVVATVATLGPGASGAGSALLVPDRLADEIDPVLLSGDPLRADVLVHGSDGSIDAALDAVASVGARVVRRHPRIGVVYAVASRTQLRALAASDDVERLEGNASLRTFLATSHAATRGAEVYDDTPVRDGEGRVVDGRGVGVAVIDSGVDGTHPDLAANIARNYEVVCNCTLFDGGLLPVTNSDEGGGHGTHVAGTVAGTGASSDGTIAGAARGASLYAIGAGAGLHILNAVAALQWVLDNHDAVDPPIRVVNNSWGGSPGRSRPTDTITKLTDALIDEGVVVVWAAGNDGGDGSAIRTNPYANNPTPGNISVANYDDRQRGDRDAAVSASSSRGVADDAGTWPDVSAPGTVITSTCRLTLPVCNAHVRPSRRYPNLYADLSGTSMAAPHVAGIVAQLLQANPELRPAEVELALEASAWKFTSGAAYVGDPAHAGASSSFDKGHGLVDVVAAISAVCTSCTFS